MLVEIQTIKAILVRSDRNEKQVLETGKGHSCPTDSKNP
jgi:hypothetical protein